MVETNKAEIRRPPLQHKSDVEEMVRAIGETIISRAEDIACDPLRTREIVITGTIGVDEIVTIEWTVMSFTDRLTCGIRSNP